MYVCLCRAITESSVLELGRAGVVTPDELIRRLGLDDRKACGFCARHIELFVAIARRGTAEASPVPDAGRSPREGATG